MESTIGVLLHRLHQHVNRFAGGYLSLFQGNEINVGAGMLFSIILHYFAF
jgi:hypothetical protein